MKKLSIRIFEVLIVCQLIAVELSEAVYSSQTRIVGGVPTTIRKAPYLVQILNGGSILCGGTLVTERHVVTAAHCFDRKPTRLTIVGGATKLTETGIRSKVSRIMMPLNYNNETFDADVAVIKLRTPLNGELVKPIDLCKGDWHQGDPVQLYGWGRRAEYADNIPIQLHTVRVKVVDTQRCATLLRYEQNLTDTMFCAGALGKDACSGDSGGPAIVKGKFCGIVSWGVGCARMNTPGVFTNIKKVEQFVTAAMTK